MTVSGSKWDLSGQPDASTVTAKMHILPCNPLAKRSYQWSPELSYVPHPSPKDKADLSLSQLGVFLSIALSDHWYLTLGFTWSSCSPVMVEISQRFRTPTVVTRATTYLNEIFMVVFFFETS